jgi:glycosyltransferase involved in cell wall biosynthesis
MSDNLFAFSIAAKKDWDEKIQSSFWLKHLFRRKQIKLLRNGVFLDRLPKRISFSAQKNAQNLRLVFLGRPIKWKGSETIFKLLQMDQLSEAKGLFFFPYENKELLSNLPVTVRSRIKIIIGKSIKDYSPQKGDVHLYPANYGNKAKFIESISINCLEMAAIGIPSCVTIGGLETWPEFLHNSLINEVDWDDLHKTADTIAQLHKSNLSDVDLIKVRKLVTIENHIQQLLEYTSLTKA